MKIFITLFSVLSISLISCNKDAESCCSLETSKECKTSKDSTDCCKDKEHKACDSSKDKKEADYKNLTEL